MKKTEFRKFKRMFDGLEYLKDENIDKFEQWIKEHPECLEEPNFDDLEDEIDDFFGSTERRAEAFIKQIAQFCYDMINIKNECKNTFFITNSIRDSFNESLLEIIKIYIDMCNFSLFIIDKICQQQSMFYQLYYPQNYNELEGYVMYEIRAKLLPALPQKLATTQAKMILIRAIVSNLITIKDKQYRKTEQCSSALLAYLTVRIYCRNLDGTNNKKPYPATALNKLFGEKRLDQAKTQIENNDYYVKGRELVDALFY
ncbi:MAG: hypothetical protein R3Y51_06110 [Rikenellaceae bacterium]